MKKPKCIMLIDDNKLDNFFHKRVITKHDETIEVIEMISAIDALEYLTDTETKVLPDIIFLDINMPGMNGWEFLEEYQKLSAEIQRSMIVIMLTTSENPNEKERAEDIGILADFRSKPLDKQSFSEISDKYHTHYQTL